MFAGFSLFTGGILRSDPCTRPVDLVRSVSVKCKTSSVPRSRACPRRFVPRFGVARTTGAQQDFVKKSTKSALGRLTRLAAWDRFRRNNVHCANSSPEFRSVLGLSAREPCHSVPEASSDSGALPSDCLHGQVTRVEPTVARQSVIGSQSLPLGVANHDVVFRDGCARSAGVLVGHEAQLDTGVHGCRVHTGNGGWSLALDSNCQCVRFDVTFDLRGQFRARLGTPSTSR